MFLSGTLGMHCGGEKRLYSSQTSDLSCAPLQKEKRKMTWSEAKQDVKCFQTHAYSFALFKTWIQLTNFIPFKLGAAVLFVKDVRKLQTRAMKHLRSPEAYLAAARFPPTQKEPPSLHHHYSATRSF